MPHWTNKFPLWSGRELTMPFNPIERILTLSPNFSCLGATVFFGACLAFKERLSFFSEIFPRTFSLVFSKSLMEAPYPLPDKYQRYCFNGRRTGDKAVIYSSLRLRQHENVQVLQHFPGNQSSWENSGRSSCLCIIKPSGFQI